MAMVDKEIVGMVSIMKTDYYPLPEIYPWVSSLFVAEKYRGFRISEKLIEFANAYAKECGFERTYIPSGHVGLYEKYGYHYLKEAVTGAADIVLEKKRKYPDLDASYYLAGDKEGQLNAFEEYAVRELTKRFFGWLSGKYGGIFRAVFVKRK